jgi:type III secretory pathway component EscR
MMDLSKEVKIFLSIIGVILTLFIIAFVILGNVSNAKEYKLGDDTIKSIKTIVGKRKLTFTSSKVSNDVTEKEYVYKSDTVREDLEEYVEYLIDEEEFLIIKSIDLTKKSSTFQLGKESEDSDEIILMTIDYNSSGYTINMVKGEGTLTRY